MRGRRPGSDTRASGIRARSSRYLAVPIATAGISLLTLPLTTRELGPRDYGVFALGTAIAGAGVSLAVLGVPYVLANRWATAHAEARTSLVSTLTATGLAVSTGWGVVVGVLFLAFRDRVAILGELPGTGIALLVAGLVLAPLSIVAFEILTVEGEAGYFAASAVASAVATAAATLVALFAFDAGLLSLFVGGFAGGAVAAVAAVPVLRPYLSARYDRRWSRELAQSSFLPAVAAETAQPVVERLLLSQVAGFAALGLYTHSQRYRSLVMQGAKAVSRGVWPVTLAEARDDELRFSRTGRTWELVHVGVIAAGLAMTVLGDFAISLLTNGKFTDAWVYLGPWFGVALLHLSGKPQVGLLNARGQGSRVARVALTANLAWLVATAGLIPLFGTWGAVAALLTQAAFYRLAVELASRRIAPAPFQDRWVVVGISLIAVAFAGKLAVGDDLLRSLGLLVAVETACLLGASRFLRVPVGALPRLGARKI